MPKYSQLAKFAIVGFASNGVLYVAYLLLTDVGLGPKTSVSILFALGVTLTFLLNKVWTFDHMGDGRRAYLRYWAAYGFAYTLNLGMLEVFVDQLGYPHKIVQGSLVVVIAAFLFFLQKFWVFQRSHAGERTKLGDPGQQ